MLAKVSAVVVEDIVPLRAYELSGQEPVVVPLGCSLPLGVLLRRQIRGAVLPEHQQVVEDTSPISICRCYALGFLVKACIGQHLVDESEIPLLE
jgi:hypothetical protein